MELRQTERGPYSEREGGREGECWKESQSEHQRETIQKGSICSTNEPCQVLLRVNVLVDEINLCKREMVQGLERGHQVTEISP